MDQLESKTAARSAYDLKVPRRPTRQHAKKLAKYTVKVV